MLEYCEENNFPKAICGMYYSDIVSIYSNLSAKAQLDRLKRRFSKYVSYKRRASNLNSTIIMASTSVLDSSSGG
eukprot:gene8206-33_t